MSLSQKHSGLVLVPWLNSEEWNYVYKELYSSGPEQNQRALEVMKIWKLRTPILSTGLEGSLIILDVLTSSLFLNTEQLRYVYSIGIMRFLNLSAANSEKQGEFTKMSNKNDLPDWLIHLRHEIAHGHKMPSLAMLKQGLEFALSWLREKYWIPQSKIINDFQITEKTHPNDALHNALLTYVDIKLNVFQGKDLNSTWLQRAKEIIFKKTKKRLADVKMMTDILEEMIRQSLMSSQNKTVDEKSFFHLLVTPDALLHSLGADNTDFSKLNEDFRSLWQNLLNIIHENKILLRLVRKLFDVTSNFEFSDNLRNLSALWIREIFEALLELKESKFKEIQEIQQNEIKEEIIKSHIISFEFSEFYEKESIEFQQLVLAKPSGCSKEFVIVLLKYNENSNGIVEDALNVINPKTSHKECLQNIEDHIFTLEDLKVEPNFEEKLRIITTVRIKNVDKKIIDVGPTWTKIGDTSSFENCPLGLLPHQIGTDTKHPLLVI